MENSYNPIQVNREWEAQTLDRGLLGNRPSNESVEEAGEKQISMSSD